MQEHKQYDGPTLPARTIDPDASLDERLTDNAIENIGPSRYFQSEDGDIYEDWADVFERVAQNLAVAEAVHFDVTVELPVEELADRASGREDISGDVLLTEETAPLFTYDAVRDALDDEHTEYLEQQAERFETAMRELRWMPNTPTLINAGTEMQQLSACFVTSPGDSLTEPASDGRASIMGTAEDAADIMQTGGGVGYPFHLLRPKGARVSSTDGKSSGPVSFMEIYDAVCGTIKQGGARRGAQMGVMHVEHPDVGRFCVAKRGESSFTNFNISVGITDEFLTAVENDDEYTLFDPSDGWPDPDAFDAVRESRHFYSTEYEDAWNEAQQKAGGDDDGNPVEENFWRDYQQEMADPDAFDEFRDKIDITEDEPLTLPARFIWQLIIDGAYTNGEPGFVYLDEINEQHSFAVDEQPEHAIHATNPCAEQPLENYEPCNLGHVNLSLMVDEDVVPYDEWIAHNLADFDDYMGDRQVGEYLEYVLDMGQLMETTQMGTRFLDNVVTMSEFPLDEISETARSMRKIGLGIMGFHHMCMQLGIEYGSDISILVAEEIMRRVDLYATMTSQNMAQWRGTFPEWEDSKWAAPNEHPEWIRTHGHGDPEMFPGGLKMRNHNVTTVAPTGTTSMIGNTTGGCEPLYNVAYFKNVSDDVQGGEMLVEIDDYFMDVLEANDIDPEAVRDEIQDKMLDEDKTFDGVDDLASVPDAIADVFVTTEDLNVEQHIDIQGAMQKHVDSGISKTLNMAPDTDRADVGAAIKRALDQGIKGATIYRIGSRMTEVKTTNTGGGGTTVANASTQELAEELVDRTDGGLEVAELTGENE